MRKTLGVAAFALLAAAAITEHERTLELQAQLAQVQMQLANSQSRLGRLGIMSESLREAKAELGTLNGMVDQLKNTALAYGYGDRVAAALGIQSAVNEIENAANGLESIIDDAIVDTRGSL